MTEPQKESGSKSTLGPASLAGVGFTLVGNVVVGLVLGLVAAKYLHWTFAVPVFLLLGFASGFASMYRQLTRA